MGRTAGSTSWTGASARAPECAPQRVALGRIVGAHGLRGQLRVRLQCESDDNLRAGAIVRLARAEGDPKPIEARVRTVGTGRRGEARLALDGVDSRDAAEALRGRWVLIDVERLDPLGDGEYYQYQLVGCRVEDGDGRALGVVTGIWETGAPDVLVVDGADGDRELLIPAAREILREVDVAARRIVVDAPPGLFDRDPGKSRAASRRRAKTRRLERGRK